MDFHGAWADRQVAGHFLVTMALSQGIEHFAFTVAEIGDAHTRFEHAPTHFGVRLSFMGHFAEHASEFILAEWQNQIAERAGLDRRDNMLDGGLFAGGDQRQPDTSLPQRAQQSRYAPALRRIIAHNDDPLARRTAKQLAGMFIHFGMVTKRKGGTGALGPVARGGIDEVNDQTWMHAHTLAQLGTQCMAHRHRSEFFFALNQPEPAGKARNFTPERIELGACA